MPPDGAGHHALDQEIGALPDGDGREVLIGRQEALTVLIQHLARQLTV